MLLVSFIKLSSLKSLNWIGQGSCHSKRNSVCLKGGLYFGSDKPEINFK